VSLVLYPLSAFRAMNKAAENVYTAMRRDGTQKNVIDTMQTRMELYDASATTPSSRSSMRCSPQKKGLQPRLSHTNAVVGAEAPCEQHPQTLTNSRKETPWPKQKYSVAQACVARWPADRTVHRGPGRCRPDLSRLRRARPGGRREFEEVAYLLLYGELPTKAELAAYKRKLKLRDLPQALKEVLERIPPTPTRWT
jgi:hypothetical protein